MAKHNYRLRPKAISLTLFVRLYLADWFIHGIGGGIYEIITTHIIERYYKIKTLYFGIATATLTLSSEDHNNSICYAHFRLKSQFRELNFNPERFIKSSLLKKDPIKSLIRRKKELIEAAKNPNLSTNEKKKAWKLISEVNKDVLKYTQQSLRDLISKAELSRRNKLSKEVVNYREFFFGLFPEEKLRNFLNVEQVK